MTEDRKTLLDRLRSLLGPSSAEPEQGAPSCADPSDAEGMLSCEEALEKVHDFLDGELDDVPAAQLRRHFEVCQGCYPHLKLETVFREALRRATSGQCAPEKLRTRITALIDEARVEEAGAEEG